MDTAVAILAIYAALVTVLMPFLIGRTLGAMSVESLGISVRIHVAINLIAEVLDAQRFTHVEHEKLHRAVLMLIAEQEVYGAQKGAQHSMRDVTPKQKSPS